MASSNLHTMPTRRFFLKQSMMAGAALQLQPIGWLKPKEDVVVMTVNGPVKPNAMHFTLTHEHVLADFIGADNYSKERYNAEEVYAIALPFLSEVKNKGCSTFVDCSPAYLGRDVRLLQRLSAASGLNIITNTGYYGAVGEKFLPRFVYQESAEQIASRWIMEWKEGIEGTGIKPGFIKTSVDKAPLSPAQRKIIDAAALTHLAMGLTIGVHTGDGKAAGEQLEILNTRGVSPEARIWIHAQNEKDPRFHTEAAKKGSWVSFDGVNPNTISENLVSLLNMKNEKLLQHVLVSQDSGWYHVGEPGGGEFKNYTTIFNQLIPALEQNGFTRNEIDGLFIINPAKAFTISVRKQ
jgi:predicted metal-dependent phosphotriesterase family hydrolase